MNIWQRLRALLAYEPAVVAWAANGGIAALLGVAVHLPAGQLDAVTTITTALAAVYTAFRTRPVAVSVITGAVATIGTACAAFGLHVAPAVLATGVTVLSSLLGLWFRSNVTPAASRPPRPVG